MAGVITVILILVFSILITRVASIALTHTGLSRESSKFQARRAFTGVDQDRDPAGRDFHPLYLANSQWVDSQLSRVIKKLLKRYGGLDVRDYATLLQLAGEYRIAEIGIECDHWL